WRKGSTAGPALSGRRPSTRSPVASAQSTDGFDTAPAVVRAIPFLLLRTGQHQDRFQGREVDARANRHDLGEPTVLLIHVRDRPDDDLWGIQAALALPRDHISGGDDLFAREHLGIGADQLHLEILVALADDQAGLA